MMGFMARYKFSISYLVFCAVLVWTLCERGIL